MRKLLFGVSLRHTTLYKQVSNDFLESFARWKSFTKQQITPLSQQRWHYLLFVFIFFFSNVNIIVNINLFKNIYNNISMSIQIVYFTMFDEKQVELFHFIRVQYMFCNNCEHTHLKTKISYFIKCFQIIELIYGEATVPG